MKVSFEGPVSPSASNTTQEQGAGLFYHISDEESGNFMITLLLEINSWFYFGPEEQ